MNKSFTKLILPFSYTIMKFPEDYFINLINNRCIVGNIYYKIQHNHIWYAKLYLEYDNKFRNNIITEFIDIENNKHKLIINNFEVKKNNDIEEWNIYQILKYDLMNIYSK
jgi:hypothetical protein